jgi:N utilization substance protein A
VKEEIEVKLLFFSDQPGIDPVGACVGQKGIRVKSVTDELGGDEKVDIIQYHEDDTFFIREALSPAKVTSVEIDAKAKRAKVFVDEEQAPLAIGRGGVNVNLASRLTEYELDIVQTEKKEDKKPKEVDEEIEANESTAVDPFLEETSKNAVNVEATEKKTKKKNTKKTDTE